MSKCHNALCTLSLIIAIMLSLNACTAPILLAGGAAGLGYYFGSERRDANTITQDKKAESYMNTLLEKAGYDPNNILVRIFNHKMILLGRARSLKDIKKLSNLATKTPYIQRVYNRVEIGPPLSEKQKTQDALLAAKIKAALIAEKGLNSAAIKYEVFNGHVYLMGLVTQQEAQKAIAAIRKVKGVKKIIDAMERL